MIANQPNPYAPGPAHQPPYLAGREQERKEFNRLLRQRRILENMILTGLRGVGKTVLLTAHLKPDAIKSGWLWVENSFSESASVSEEHLASRLLADLSLKTAEWQCASFSRREAGFTAKEKKQAVYLPDMLESVYHDTRGLTADKIKAALETVWETMQKRGKERGIVFSYDEAQNLVDHKAKTQYPLSVLIDVFSSLQSRGMPFLLLLTGLPTLFAKLVDARAYAERMFHVVTLKNLNREETRNAMLKPLRKNSPERDYFDRASDSFFEITRGYPYFVQYWCKEWFDYYFSGAPYPKDPRVVIEKIRDKLDQDFFEGRWGQLTDRERDLLGAVARLSPNKEGEFSALEIISQSAADKKFSSSHANQMLSRLGDKGMVFKNRRGKYVLAVPMLDDFIRRRILPESDSASATR